MQYDMQCRFLLHCVINVSDLVWCKSVLLICGRGNQEPISFLSCHICRVIPLRASCLGQIHHKGADEAHLKASSKCSCLRHSVISICGHTHTLCCAVLLFNVAFRHSTCEAEKHQMALS